MTDYRDGTYCVECRCVHGSWAYAHGSAPIDPETVCEYVSYSGSISRGTAESHRCSRPASWTVTTRRVGNKIAEVRCSWHRRVGMNARPIDKEATR